MHRVRNVDDYKAFKRDRSLRRCIYHIGHLQQDRWQTKVGSRAFHRVQPLWALADAILLDAEYDEMIIYQRRIKANVFSYEAVKPLES